MDQEVLYPSCERKASSPDCLPQAKLRRIPGHNLAVDLQSNHPHFGAISIAVLHQLAQNYTLELRCQYALV